MTDAKSDSYETGVLQLIFQNTVTALSILDDLGEGISGEGLTGSDAPGNIYVSLHTSSPGDVAATGQSTNEITTGEYGEYARVGVARSAGGWSVTGDTASNVAAVTFVEMATGTTATVTHFGLGTDASGDGNLLYHGVVTPTLAMANGITPQFDAGALAAQET